jgi:pilus assembly protein CpaC
MSLVYLRVGHTCYSGSVWRAGIIAVGLFVSMSWRLQAQPPEQVTVIRSQHLRLPLPSDIQRIAVGDPDLLSAEPLNTRELLLLGKRSGRTTLLVWFRNGTVVEYLVSVHRDLSLLQSALKRIHPSIEAEIAPDRDAIVLTGLVPDITYSRAAEGAAHNYLDAQGGAGGRVLVQDQGTLAPPAPQPATPPAPGAAPSAVPPPAEAIRVPAALQVSGTVINLIRLENLPPLPEDKILDAIQNIGGGDVKVRRVIKGQVRDDNVDIFVIEGRVPNQVALTRILTVASEILTGPAVGALQNLQVIADEAGSLATGQGGQGGGVGGGGGSGGGGGIGGGGGGGLSNQVRRNIARAKAISAGGGRLLSFLEVADIPQVRVNIRLFEVSRSKLRTYSSNFASAVGSAKFGSLNPSSVSQTLAGQRVGPGNAVQTVLGFLGGSLSTETQLTTAHFVLDSVLSYLEQQGIVRSLSSPSLTVLSGEIARFQVGGEVPIPQSSAFGGAVGPAGVFNSVVFHEFGVQLNVRPLVGDDDTVTIDVTPQITTPDAGLTSTIRQNTGTNLQTTAFQTRSLFTSARLQDGQALLLGGLLSRNTNDNQSSTPGVRDVPMLGWLFKNSDRTDNSTELVVVVNPAIVRDPVPNVALWEFPGIAELMEKFGESALQAPLGGANAGVEHARSRP